MVSLHTGSVAPTVISVSSSSVQAGPSKYNTSAGSLPNVGEELIELSEDEDEVKVVPKGKKHAASEHVEKRKPSKPKCSDYTGIPHKLIDATFHRICAHLGHDGMFLDDQREYNWLIQKSWILTVKEMGVDTQTYPMEDEHEACLIEHVKKLQAGEFHKKHPFIAECIHQVFFIGRRPAGTLYPKLYNLIPILALAYVCGMGEFEDAQAEASTVGGFYKNHLVNIELFQQCCPTKCEKYRATLYTEAMKLAGKGVQILKADCTGPGVLTAEDFEDEDEDEGGGR
ncbi:hypothetical protein FRC10_005157 [Ceratobasidium sp. 414]|nr:hypothetical protein FRC10_005157 [Ceratobasidium sp. 414]